MNGTATDASLKALEHRLADRLPTATGPLRLFHGRGHCYPGLEHLTVDWFPPVVVITLYADVSDDFVDHLVALLRQHEKASGVVGVLVQRRRNKGKRNAVATYVAWGEVAEEIDVDEAGLTYRVRPHANQNLGLFLDVAPLRSWLRERAAQTRVLNLFAYTCAFSVAAVAGGADSVVNLDMSRTALAVGKTNHELNNHDARRVSYLPHDLFRSWWKLKKLGPFDWVIIDPPTWQRGSFDAERDYPTIVKRLPSFVKPGGQVLALLNSPFLPPRFLTEQMARHCAQCRFECWLPAAAEFEDQFPGRALKIGLFRFDN